MGWCWCISYWNNPGFCCRWMVGNTWTYQSVPRTWACNQVITSAQSFVPRFGEMADKGGISALENGWDFRQRFFWGMTFWLVGRCLFFQEKCIGFSEMLLLRSLKRQGLVVVILASIFKKNPRCIGFDWRMSQHDCEDLKRNGMIPQFTKSCGYSNSGIWAAVENFSGCFGIEKKVCCVSAGFGQILVWKDGWLPVWYHSFASVISQIFWISFGYYFFLQVQWHSFISASLLVPPKNQPTWKT